MGRKGSQKNEQKSNADLVQISRETEATVRKALKALRSTRPRDRDENYKEQLRKLQGMLNRAINNRRDSETHGRKGKGGKL